MVTRCPLETKKYLVRSASTSSLFIDFMFLYSRRVSLNECNALIIVCETQACCPLHCLNTVGRDNSDLTLAIGVHVGDAVRSIVSVVLFCS